MTTVNAGAKTTTHPLATNMRRPKGILKNSTHSPPPVSPIKEVDLSEKELTIVNTQANAGHRRSSSSASRPAIRHRLSRTSSLSIDDGMGGNPRLQWDEANLYLTEQERTSTMKITEPKTPYARHYEPSEDEDEEMTDGDSIPRLSLGEPEEDIPQQRSTSRKPSKVHVNDMDATPDHDAENDYFGMTPEEREKHRKFEELRKKHYEMKGVARFLGHPEDLDEMEDENDQPPAMPAIDGAKFRANK
ncbi:hypothetical protein GGR50DRAFT_654072 [Xylaria sp. CBS 124048]|nr:hypothetical protein GGR50DRAFT_654072 [Xylaria sp. CBS 124048]